MMFSEIGMVKHTFAIIAQVKKRKIYQRAVQPVVGHILIVKLVVHYLMINKVSKVKDHDRKILLKVNKDGVFAQKLYSITSVSGETNG